MGLSLPHLIILALVVLVLFGRGKVSELMGDFGKGVSNFKRGVSEHALDGLPHLPANKTDASSNNGDHVNRGVIAE